MEAFNESVKNYSPHLKSVTTVLRKT